MTFEVIDIQPHAKCLHVLQSSSRVSRKQWLFASVSEHLMCMCYRWSWPWLLSADGFQTWGKRTVSCGLLGESLFTVWMMSGDFIFLSSSDCKQLLMSQFCVYFSHKCSQFVLSFVPVLAPLRQRGRLETSLWKLLLINSERERERKVINGDSRLISWGEVSVRLSVWIML